MKKLVMLVALGFGSLVHGAYDGGSDTDSVVAENAEIAEKRNKLALVGSKNSYHQLRRNKQAAITSAQLVCSMRADQQSLYLSEFPEPDENANLSIASSSALTSSSILSSSSLKSPNSSFDCCKSCPNS